MRGSAWDKLKTSLCLIVSPNGTGTGLIGRKGRKLYLVTCRHIFVEENSASAEAILRLAQEGKFQFAYIDKKPRPDCVLKGDTLLQNEIPVRPKVCANHKSCHW